MVARRRRLPVVEHLVQRRGLHLRSHRTSAAGTRSGRRKTVLPTYHLHRVAEQQPLGRDGGDLVH